MGCYCCGGESSVEEWWPDDSPWVQHIRTQFDRRTGERRLNCRLLDKFSSPKARLETFKSNWPEGLAHWPDRLALAGFVNLHNARVRQSDTEFHFRPNLCVYRLSASAVAR